MGRPAWSHVGAAAVVAIAALTLPGRAALAQVVTADSTAPTAITDVRLFDGVRTVPRATVIINGDRIVRVIVGPAPEQLPSGTNLVDGRGRTLLPGFIDAHTHTFSRNWAKTATGYGVTTQLDMFTNLDTMRALRREQDRGGARDRTDVFSAGMLVTAAGGHGTQYGVPFPTLDRAADAQAFIDARIAEGSDYIKIVVEDGSAFGMTVPALDAARVRAAVEAAHVRGALAVVHVGNHDAAEIAIEAGADGLAHIFADRAPDPGFASRAAVRGTFVVPTLSVLEGTAGGEGGSALVADPRLNRFMAPGLVRNLEIRFPMRAANSQSMDHALAAVRQLHEAGVRILAGSDAPNPGTHMGVSIHRELELLVRAGLTPEEALRAATAVPAEAFGLDDRGRIAEGLRADLVLVDGDPTADILQTRNLVGIWKEGRRWKIELALLTVVVQRVRGGMPPGPPGMVPPNAILGVFDDDYGNRFTVSPDAWVLHDSARYAVMRWDTEGRYVILQNALDNPTDAGRWTRIDWEPLAGPEWSWAFCMIAYDAQTPEGAAATLGADRAALRAGCNGFPFSRMRRVEGR